MLANYSEANFWNERRKALQQSNHPSQDSFQLASLPTSLPFKDPSFISNRLPSLPQHLLSGSIPALAASTLPAEANRQLSSLLNALASQYGTIRKISLPKNKETSKVVIHIQDVHLNSEAQVNIGKTVQKLIDDNKISLIALEGAFSPIDLSNFRKFSDHETIRKVADYLLRENQISGPIHTSLTSSHDIPSVIGVDDAEHYQSNVSAYQQSAPLTKKYKKKLAAFEDGLGKLKNKTFNPQLLAFDEEVEAYQAGRVQIGDHIRFLVKGLHQINSEVQTFLDALQMESSLNFSQVESERSRLISNLIGKLDKSQSSELVNVSVAYRLGQIRHTDFYQYVRDLCTKNGVDLTRYPAMDSYIHYVLLSDGIDSEKVFEGMRQMEKAGYASLVKTQEEARLVEESRQLHLVGKLLDFSLTQPEWEEYKPSQALNASLAIKNLSSFESFYGQAEARDKGMAVNLLQAMKGQNAKVAVLVTGGFHASGIGASLNDSGVATVTFVPKITKVDSENGSTYLNVFTQEKAPLEKLFEGEKLFLSPLQTKSLPTGGLIAASLTADPQQGLREIFPQTNLKVDKRDVEGGVVAVTWKNLKTGIARTVRILATPKEIAQVNFDQPPKNPKSLLTTALALVFWSLLALASTRSSQPSLTLIPGTVGLLLILDISLFFIGWFNTGHYELIESFRSRSPPSKPWYLVENSAGKIVSANEKVLSGLPPQFQNYLSKREKNVLQKWLPHHGAGDVLVHLFIDPLLLAWTSLDFLWDLRPKIYWYNKSLCVYSGQWLIKFRSKNATSLEELGLCFRSEIGPLNISIYRGHFVQPRKKSNRDIYVLAFTGSNHDASVALYRNNVLLAALEEERITRERHDHSQFPINALLALLEDHNLTWADVDHIAIPRNYNLYTNQLGSISPFSKVFKKLDRSYAREKGIRIKEIRRRHYPEHDKEKWKPERVETFLDQMSVITGQLHRPAVTFVPHQLAHAASAYFSSGFSDRTLIIELDGRGDLESGGIWVGDGDHIELIQPINLPNTLGNFYTGLTEYMGFKPNSAEGEVMGLAAYGAPKNIEEQQRVDQFRSFLKTAVRINPQDESFALNLDYFYWGELNGKERYTVGLVEALGHLLPPAPKTGDHLDPKNPKDRAYANLAFALQERFEDVIVNLTRYYLQRHPKTRGIKYVALAGGLAYNINANTCLVREGLVEPEHLFIQPAAGDSGTPIGAAQVVVKETYGFSPRFAMRNASYGRSYSDQNIANVLKEFGLIEGVHFLRFNDDSEIVEHVAGELAQKKVVGWFQGRSEIGPRALGNRSLLLNATDPRANDIANQVKDRQWWRPSAMSITYEGATRFLDMKPGTEAPFMILAYPVRESENSSELLSSGKHLADGTTRPQTVKREQNPLFYDLLNRLGDLTSVPAVVNTSFNQKEPLVESPEEALNTFFYMRGVDVLSIGRFLILPEARKILRPSIRSVSKEPALKSLVATNPANTNFQDLLIAVDELNRQEGGPTNRKIRVELLGPDGAITKAQFPLVKEFFDGGLQKPLVSYLVKTIQQLADEQNAVSVRIGSNSPGYNRVVFNLLSSQLGDKSQRPVVIMPAITLSDQNQVSQVYEQRVSVDGPVLASDTIEGHPFRNAGEWSRGFINSLKGFGIGLLSNTILASLMVVIFGQLQLPNLWVVLLVGVASGFIGLLGFKAIHNSYGNEEIAYHLGWGRAGHERGVRKINSQILQGLDVGRLIPIRLGFTTLWVWGSENFLKDRRRAIPDTMLLTHEMMPTEALGMFFMVVFPAVLLVGIGRVIVALTRFVWNFLNQLLNRMIPARRVHRAAATLASIFLLTSKSNTANADQVVEEFFRNAPTIVGVGSIAPVLGQRDISTEQRDWFEVIKDPRFPEVFNGEVAKRLAKKSVEVKGDIVIEINEPDDLIKAEEFVRKNKSIQSVTLLTSNKTEKENLDRKIQDWNRTIPIDVYVRDPYLFIDRTLVLSRLSSSVPSRLRPNLPNILFVSFKKFEIDASGVGKNSDLNWLKVMVLNQIGAAIMMTVRDRLALDVITKALIFGRQA